jgi:hypothetical protein
MKLNCARYPWYFLFSLGKEKSITIFGKIEDTRFYSKKMLLKTFLWLSNDGWLCVSPKSLRIRLHSQAEALEWEIHSHKPLTKSAIRFDVQITGAKYHCWVTFSSSTIRPLVILTTHANPSGKVRSVHQSDCNYTNILKLYKVRKNKTGTKGPWHDSCRTTFLCFARTMHPQ